MRASARKLLVPFFTPLVWCGRDSNPRPPAQKVDALPTELSKLPFVIKIFVLSIFEWPFYTGFTVVWCFLVLF